MFSSVLSTIGSIIAIIFLFALVQWFLAPDTKFLKTRRRHRDEDPDK